MVFVVFERMNPESVYWLGMVVRGVYATEALARTRVEGMAPGSWFISEHTVEGEADSGDSKEGPVGSVQDS